VKKVVLNDFILEVFIHFFNCKYSYLFWLMRSSSVVDESKRLGPGELSEKQRD